ncbi:MAG: DUF115 domain-containing protein [Cyanobacteria bacterium]|jgi:hypothetical protein|nr:DUF115 domain-containing protein [Cyanobacteria bacterium GSL.Bin21]
MPDDNPFWSKRPTLNPYRYAFNETWKRFKWDLNPESWRSRGKLKTWKNKYLGHKAVIVCNGPSLLKSDLSLLKNIFTFGLNKINLLFDKSNFRPACIVAVNPLVINQNREFYNQTNIPLFLDSCATEAIRSRTNVTFLHSSEQFKFARDCSFSLYQGATVTFVAMQLAFHMGFKEIALIGCDHQYTAQQGLANQIVKAEKQDADHFDPNYFAGKTKWQIPDLLKSEVSYTLAKEVYYADSRTIVNATEGGCLDLFPRVRLEQFVGKQ